MAETHLTIGKVAKAAEVSIDTLRYYERIGMVSPVMRLDSGYRIYDPSSVRTLRFIKQAQGLGFTLDEIRQLIDLRTPTSARCGTVRKKAEKHLSDVKDRIGDLRRMQSALEKLIARCAQKKTDTECPIIDCLEKSKG